MDIVSFKMAKRLKEAGFPQPEFSTGQMWYNEFAAITIIGKKELDENNSEIIYFFCHSLLTSRTDRMRLALGYGIYFCTSATDILRKLGSDFDLSALETGNWILIKRDPNLQEIGIKHWIAENPAEAAALAWLEINEKQPA